MTHGEFDVGPGAVDADEASRRRWGAQIIERLVGAFRPPTREEAEARIRAERVKRWNKWGRRGFTVYIPSAEGRPSTADEVRHLYPADSLPQDTE